MIPLSAEKEKALVDALRRGKPAAKRSFYEQYYRYLAAVCSRYAHSDEDVKDLLQDVFIKIFSRFDSFEHRGPGSLQAWARRIAVNESLMRLRAEKRMPTTSIDAFGDLPEPDEKPDIADIPERELLAMIRRLPDRYRTVFNLYVFEEKSHQEIADLLHIRNSTSASDLHRAKALLSQWIKDYRKDAER